MWFPLMGRSVPVGSSYTASKSALSARSCWLTLWVSFSGPQLADMGCARIVEQGRTHVSTTTYGTVAYMPPEMLQQVWPVVCLRHAFVVRMHCITCTSWAAGSLCIFCEAPMLTPLMGVQGRACRVA